MKKLLHLKKSNYRTFLVENKTLIETNRIKNKCTNILAIPNIYNE